MREETGGNGGRRKRRLLGVRGPGYLISVVHYPRSMCSAIHLQNASEVS